MIELVDMMTLVEVVKHSSFTDAAMQLGVTKSVISRRIGDMERELGVCLLDRSPRAVRPTEIGGVYYAKCVRILESVLSANEFAAGFNHKISGRLRIILPGVLGAALFSRVLADFALRYPDVRLEIVSQPAYLGEVSGHEADGFDLLIRIGQPRETHLIARNLGTLTYRLYASPSYLELNGRPYSPEQLEKHHGLVELPHGGNGWILGPPGAVRVVSPHERMRSNNLLVLLAAAESGLGIVLSPESMVADALAGARLEALLPESEASHAVTALYPENRRSSEKLQILLTHIADRMSLISNGATPGGRIAA